MKSYIGTKVLKARPMTRSEYVAYRGWELPENEDGNDEVYLVEYPVEHDTKPNHPDHEGYISMSPKTIFEKYYKENGDFKSRLNIEYSELNEKINKLDKFLNGLDSKELEDEAYNLLVIQSASMETYLKVLEVRLENLK